MSTPPAPEEGVYSPANSLLIVFVFQMIKRWRIFIHFPFLVLEVMEDARVLTVHCILFHLATLVEFVAFFKNSSLTVVIVFSIQKGNVMSSLMLLWRE